MVSTPYHGTGNWRESGTVESWLGALGFVCALFRPEIGNRSRQGDISEAKLALCLGYSRAGTSVFPFPSNASAGGRADRNLWNAGNLDVCLGRSRIAIPPSDHGKQGHRLRAHLHGGCDLSRCGRHASFRKQLPDPQGIHSYPKALWWVAMQITNIGSGYRPATFGGHVLCLGISIFAVAIFGYLTAVFAAFFIGRDAEDPKSEIPNQTSIHQLSAEVALLRKAIEDVLKRVPAAAPQSAEPTQLPREPSKIKPGQGSGTVGQHQA